jgi:5-methylcytosine-specific restriction protein A
MTPLPYPRPLVYPTGGVSSGPGVLMPRRPPTICAHPGCGQLVTHGRCARHRRLDKNVRASAGERGYGREWRRYRRDYLLAHRSCVLCARERRASPATVIDHITPVRGPTDPRFWDPQNHQALCSSCHSRKTAAVDGGFGNEIRRALHG